MCNIVEDSDHVAESARFNSRLNNALLMNIMDYYT